MELIPGYDDWKTSPQSSSNGSGSSSGALYRVQVGAFGNEINAEKFAAELKAKGYSVIIKQY